MSLAFVSRPRKDHASTNWSLQRIAQKVVGYRPAVLKSAHGKTRFILNGAIFKSVTSRWARMPIVIERDIVPPIASNDSAYNAAEEWRGNFIRFVECTMGERRELADIREILFSRAVPWVFREAFHLGRTSRSSADDASDGDCGVCVAIIAYNEWRTRPYELC